MSGLEFLRLSDPVLLWGFNLLLQISFVSLIGLSIAASLRSNPIARYWVLCVSLFLILVAPVLSLVMQQAGPSWMSVSLVDDNLLQQPKPVEAQPATIEKLETTESRSNVATATNGNLELAFSSQPSETMNLEFPNDGPRGIDQSQLASMPRSSLQQSGPMVAPSSLVSRTWLVRGLRYFGSPILLMWFAGAMFLVIRLAVGWSRLAAILRSASSRCDASLVESYQRVGQRLQLGRLPTLLLSDQIEGPISAGWRKPCVVLPTSLVDQISAPELHDILVHEVAHVVRRDQWIVLLQNIAGAILWLHPVVSWLNRSLGQSREEVCDNYVLTTTNASSYSRTLLSVAELVQSSRSLPGSVGLFTSRWKLESRVAGLLDESRSRSTELSGRGKVTIAAMAVALLTATALGTVSLAADDEVESSSGVVMRGSGLDREMLLRGQVFDDRGKPADDFTLGVTQRKAEGRSQLATNVQGNNFSVWVPVGGSDWFHLDMVAKSATNETRSFKGISMDLLRKAATGSVELTLAKPDRKVTVVVRKEGRPVSNATVAAQLSYGSVPSLTTDTTGVTVFNLLPGEKFSQLSAWTNDYWIGGYSLYRPSARNAIADSYTIDLTKCRDQKIRVVNDANDSPIANVGFQLILGTGRPNYNCPATPDSMPQLTMTTDQHGEAIFRWFPDWEKHDSYIDVDDDRWFDVRSEVTDKNLNADENGDLEVRLKHRKRRYPLKGQVIADGIDVGGISVKARSFQAEREGYIDQAHAFTDSNGHFSIDCLPDSTYCVYVNDTQFVSNTIDLIPCQSETKESQTAALRLSEGAQVEVQLTQGPDRAPIRNQFVHLRSIYHYRWRENGKSQSGTSGKSWHVATDENGIARTTAAANTKLQVDVYDNDWRSRDNRKMVKEGEVTRFEIHRADVTVREVTGRIVASDGVETGVADVKVVLGAMDGQSTDELITRSDQSGRFSFRTTALRVGVFAITDDGTAAGAVNPGIFNTPVELVLKPTVDLSGQILDLNGEPMVGQRVWVKVDIHPGDTREYTIDKHWFRAKDFEATTDHDGRYVIRGLPVDLLLDIDATDPNDASHIQSLDMPRLRAGQQVQPLVSRIRRWKRSDNRSLSEKYAELLEFAKNDRSHLLVVIHNSTSEKFVENYLFDDSRTREARTFIPLRIDESQIADDANAAFVSAQGWPKPQDRAVVVYALGKEGEELERVEIRLDSDNPSMQAAEFLRRNAVAELDAEKKWLEAFTEAGRSQRKVWARVGNRHCGPCRLLSGWLDEHAAILEQDYVLLKIDTYRDRNANGVAKRIAGDYPGIPFHAIYDADGNRIIDSDGPEGNIGYPSADEPEGMKHFKRMLDTTRAKLTEAQVEHLIESLVD